ncbi:DUF2859 domain-containing protein [Vibrio agarivorans]|uniref:DUF2859 domain-containing protein n=1 Tax=Vibrio agarivorans TaxID=153622 RepID=A0ABT7Y708_9VIBR|nr:DUF2859 domain-containing protein [Vibrio agarivorans]MDN2483831.1 DUF2859 domain-containing protein [Vibrio agarivorans]
MRKVIAAILLSPLGVTAQVITSQNHVYTEYLDYSDKPQDQVETVEGEYQLPEYLQEFVPIEGMDEDAIDALTQVITESVEHAWPKYLRGETQHTVIADSNTAVPLEEVIDLEEYFGEDDDPASGFQKELTRKILSQDITKEDVIGLYEEMVFPIEPTIKQRVMPAQYMPLNPEYKEAILMPMAAIGTDRYSLQWLELNKEEIANMGSIVFVTQIENFADFQMLQTRYPTLQFMPVNAEAALGQFGVDFYPVLITRDGIFQ